MNSARSTASSPAEQRARIGGGVIERIFTHAQDRPDAVAVCEVGDDGCIRASATYAWLADRITRHRGGMDDASEAWHASDRGTVILSGTNSIGYVCELLGMLHRGLRIAPVAPTATVEEVRAIAGTCGARGVVSVGDVAAAADKVGAVEAIAGRVPKALAVGRAGVILQSSGTTGRPRLAFRDLEALDAVARNVAESARLNPDDCVLATMPLTHSYGIDVLLAALWAGAVLHVSARFEPIAVAAQLNGSITVFPTVPFAVEALTRLGTGRRPPQLRLVYTAGAPLPPRIGSEFERAWGVAVGQLYGATELGSVTLADPEDSAFDPRSVGVPMRGVGICIVNPEDPSSTRPEGVEGEVAVRAPSMMSGYLDGDAALIDGHLLTGDLGMLDDRGRLTITGRRKLMIDVGGYKVNPAEVEAVLAEHPGVAECIVAPLPVSETVTRLRAVYVARDPAAVPAESSLRAFLRERLSGYKIPRIFDRAEALPRSASGKVLRDRIPAAGACR